MWAAALNITYANLEVLLRLYCTKKNNFYTVFTANWKFYFPRNGISNEIILMCDCERCDRVEDIKVRFYCSNSVDSEMEELWFQFY